MSENNLYRQYSEALGPKRTRSLLLNQSYWQQNIQQMIKRSGNKKIRIATKSIRSRALLEELTRYSPQISGLMTFTLAESLWLRSMGFKDILLGYPTWDHEALENLAQDPSGITLMIDRLEHLVMLDEYARRFNTQFNLCLDVDLSLDLPGLRFGVFRSSIQQKDDLQEIVSFLKSRTQTLSLTALMGYEAQVAGVADKGKAHIKLLKKKSIQTLRQRRLDLVNFLKAQGFAIVLVNGGGTGSLESTSLEECVTEVTVGSGFYGPKLFDGYSQFDVLPALSFSLPVVRNPKEGIYTCLGGGYIASGMMGPDRLPSPFLPEGLELLKFEGAGEVQTPLRSKVPLNLGSPIFFRHAKAGEICEHFHDILIYENNKISRSVKTYRGEGQCFL